jgi:hypothetical protein
MTPRPRIPGLVTAAALLPLLVGTVGWTAEPIAAPPAFSAPDRSAAPAAPSLPPATDAAAHPLAPFDLAPAETPTTLFNQNLEGPLFGAPIDATLPRPSVVPAAQQDAPLNGKTFTSSMQRALAPQNTGVIGETYSSGPLSPGTVYAPFSPQGATYSGTFSGSGAMFPPATTAAEKLATLPISQFNPDEATVRISDRPLEETLGDVPGVRPSHRICPHCRYCPHGLPYHECPECEPCPAMLRRYRARHGITLPPDYGWSPPGYYPMDRISIDYYRAFPAAWSGQPTPPQPPMVRPTVYWPTDTTQLGYTYQHSPRWMPYPGMVPPVPHPGQWHIPLCGASGGYGGSAGGCPHCRENGARSSPPANGSGGASQPPPLPPEPTAAVQYPFGPQLRSSASAPALTPVPF